MTSLEVFERVRYLPLLVRFDLPAPRQLQLSISETVQEGHQVAVVLVALEIASIATDLQDHVFETRAVGKHTIRPLQHKEKVMLTSIDPCIFSSFDLNIHSLSSLHPFLSIPFLHPSTFFYFKITFIFNSAHISI